MKRLALTFLLATPLLPAHAQTVISPQRPQVDFRSQALALSFAELMEGYVGMRANFLTAQAKIAEMEAADRAQQTRIAELEARLKPAEPPKADAPKP